MNSKYSIKCCIYCSLHGKSHLTSCTLLTRRSTSVLKVGVPCVGCKAAYKTRLAYSVTEDCEVLEINNVNESIFDWLYLQDIANQIYGALVI